MDLVRLGKKPFIPLPANMNNYTWQKNYKKGLAPYAEQDDFKIDYLPQIKSIVDCSTLTRPWLEQLFSVFKFKNNTKIKNLVYWLLLFK
jgi:hypothetical protein